MVTSLHVGNQLMQNVTFVLQMPQHPITRMRLLVVPALAVDAVRAENLQIAPIQFGREHVDHAPVFILKKFAHGTGEYNHGRARMAENQQVRLALHFAAKAFMRFAIHSKESNKTPYFKKVIYYLKRSSLWIVRVPCSPPRR